MRTAFIGDVGGHRKELERALTALGADVATGDLPDDLAICQVGDLVHRGPDSLGVLHLMDRFLTGPARERVTALVGNHETVHLFSGGGQFRWNEQLPTEVDDIIRRWYADGLLTWAAAFDSREHGQILATHAGLTTGLWRKLGSPKTAQRAALEINQAGVNQVAAPGRMLGGGRSNWNAGVIWAEAGWELYLSWLEHARGGALAPFAQVHGHSSAFAWARKVWSSPDLVTAHLSVDARRRHVTGTFGGRLFAGIDPDFGRHAGVAWEPFVLDDCAPMPRLAPPSYTRTG